jgi:hypothetical protein
MLNKGIYKQFKPIYVICGKSAIRSGLVIRRIYIRGYQVIRRATGTLGGAFNFILRHLRAIGFRETPYRGAEISSILNNSRTKRRAKGPWPLVGESKLSALDKCLNNFRFNILINIKRNNY